MIDPAPDRARRVQKLFEAALDLDERARSAFLRQECAGDGALCEEVEGLLASLGRAHTAEVLPPLFPPTEPPPSLVGTRVHNYEVVAPLAAGGMGVVYRARHLLFDRQAALKVLQPELSRQDDMVQRFINEARAADAIHHPNIIQVIDAGRLDGGGPPYILMEYLDGESLAARVRRGPVPITEAVRIARETAHALGAAHDRGIVHRDLKPENLFLVNQPGEEPLVKVLDFGVAKLRADLGGGSALTQTGTFLGTPLYMSPEQCRNVSTVDQRSDVYALGAILYEMLCGRPPFLSSGGIGDIVYQHFSVVPEPPRRHRPETPAALQAVVLRCLAKEADQRFPSMHALVEALTGERPASRPRRPRRALVVAVVATFVLALAASAGLALRRVAANHPVAPPPMAAAAPVPERPSPPARTTPVAETVPPPGPIEPAPRPKRRDRRPDIPAVLKTNPY